MAQWKVPGVAVAVVKDGQAILTQGFGKRDLSRNLDVTENTLFGIGSCTKAFTALGLAALVDQGKVDWDGLVRTYLPEFQLQDPVASALVTVRDLLTHRSGLPRHDAAGFGSSADRKTLIQRLRYLQPSKSFRAVWQYNNLLYMAAGYLAGQVAGQTWEQFTQQAILQPLGMHGTRLSAARPSDTDDFALPYALIAKAPGDPQPTEVAFPTYVDPVAPAGSIVSSVADLSKWLMLHAGKEAASPSHIVSDRQLAEMHSPQMVAQADPVYLEWPGLVSYGLGWFVRPYRGALTLYHDGADSGFSAYVTVLPDAHFGFAAISNVNGSLLPVVIALNALDRVLGLDPIPWTQRLMKEQGTADQTATASKSEASAGATPDAKPAHSLGSYAGQYDNPGYGPLSIDLDNNHLKLTFNSFTAALIPQHADVFQLQDSLAKLEGTTNAPKASFLTGPKGDINAIAIPFEPAVADIVFSRKPTGASPPAEAVQLTGTYVASMRISVARRKDGVLVLSVAGQPDAELQPVAGTVFTVKGVGGTSVDFKTDGSGAAAGLVLNTPSGPIIAPRA